MAMGVIYFSWAQDSLSNSYSIIKQTSRGAIDQSKEKLVIENARFLDRSLYSGVLHELNITIRNIGSIDCRITALYLNTTNVFEEVDEPSINGGFYHLLLSDNTNTTRAQVTFMFIDAPVSIPLTEGSIVNIIVITERGTKVNAIWEVGP